MSAAFTDAQLLAFLDGTIDDSAGDAIEAAINADPALAQRVEALAEGTQDPAAAMVREAFDPVLTAPVPGQLFAAVTAQPAAEVVNLAQARDQRATKQAARMGAWRWPQLTAMAASLAVGVLVGGPLLDGAGSDGALVLAGAQGPVTPTAIAAMLDSAPSGEAVDLGALGSGEVVLTFRNLDGQLCRQFTLEGAGGTSDALACAGSENGAWQLEALGKRAAPVGEMQLAGGDAAVGVVAAVDAMIDSDPLVGASEAEALAKKK